MLFEIKNFCKDPMKKRQEALTSQLETLEHDGVKYPSMCEFEDKESWRLLEFHLDKKLRSRRTIYRKYPHHTEQPTFIHNDSYIGDLSAILFLNTDGTPDDGLAFWQHKERGMKTASTRGFKTEEEFQQFFDDQYDESKWDMYRFFPMVFNTMVVFDSRLYHSRYPMVRNTAKEERLIQAFFMK